MIAVDNSESIAALNGFVSQCGMTMPLLREGVGFYSLFGTGAIPYHIVLDRDHI